MISPGYHSLDEEEYTSTRDPIFQFFRNSVSSVFSKLVVIFFTFLFYFGYRVFKQKLRQSEKSVRGEEGVGI